MAGLGKNIKRDDKRRSQRDKDLSKIQIGTSFKTKDSSRAKFKRYTFSLTDDVSHSIDKLILKSRKQRLSRSDIVKIGIASLDKLSIDEFEEIVMQLK